MSESATNLDQPDFCIQTAIEENRAWLAGYCAALTGDRDVAEDLAQESLIEAWRHLDRLNDPASWRPWLAGIARNVARRWRRAEAARPATVVIGSSDIPASLDADPETEFLNRELVSIVWRALPEVPDDSRRALVEHSLAGRPQAMLAEALQLNEGAVSARVHRGKKSLLRVLEEPAFRSELAAYGFRSERDTSWRETRIHCPLCGQHTLLFQQDYDLKCLTVRCRGECPLNPGGNIIGSTPLLPESSQMASPKALLTRHLNSIHLHYQEIFQAGGRDCPRCGEFVPMRTGVAESRFPAGVYLECRQCVSYLDDTSLWHLALDRPEAQRFWRKHPRIRALPIEEVDHEGIPALRTGFEDQSARNRLEVRFSPDRYHVLRVETVLAG